MKHPVRLQLSRRRGFNLRVSSRAVNGLRAVNCARPGEFGNPARIGDYFTFTTTGWMVCRERKYADANHIAVTDNKAAVEIFAELLDRGFWLHRFTDIRDRNLACWCRLCARHAAAGKPFDEACKDCAPCHTDVLGARANGFVCEGVA